MYIGYINKVSSKYKKYIIIGIVFVSCFIVGSATVYSLYQRSFLNGTFELQEERTLEGILFSKPFPMLKVELRKGVFKDVMLVNKGKFGYQKTLEEKGIKDNTFASVTGHMIYFNGQVVLEVDHLELVEKKKREHFLNNYIEIGQKNITGEIVDPKCYFGIMKPGYGKIHRSCAVRCLSGGIPAVLVSRQNPMREEYYVITFNDKIASNNDLLPYVGKTITLNGNFKKGKSWSLLELNTSSPIIVKNNNSPSYYNEVNTLPTENVLCVH